MFTFRTLALGLLLLAPGAALVAQQNDPLIDAEMEAVRRQETTIQLRQSLAKADTSLKAGDIPSAAKYYEETLAGVQKVGAVGVEVENQKAIAGLTVTRLRLATDAQRAGKLDEADAQVKRILAVDPRSEPALKFKATNDKMLFAQRGRIPSKDMQLRVPDFINEKTTNSTLVQDGKLLWEMGKLEEAAEKLTLATKVDPANRAAYYYLSLVQEARYAEEARKTGVKNKQKMVDVQQGWNDPVKRDLLPTPNPWAGTNLVFTGSGRQAIVSKLNRIELNEIFFDGIPLSEVVKFLNDEARKRDPEKKGINFIVNSAIDAPAPTQQVAVDPNTGATINVPPPDPLDVNSVNIKINPPLTNIRLADALDAITQVADKPIKYSISDYAIIFTQKRPEAAQLISRTFKVNPNTFMEGLESVGGTILGGLQTGTGGGGGGGGGGGAGGAGGQGVGIFIVPRVNTTDPNNVSGGQGGGGGGFGGGGGGGGQGLGGITAVTRTNLAQNVQDIVRNFFAAAGVNFTPPSPNLLFFNERQGVLWVRATQTDLDVVESAIQVLNVLPQNVMIEAKFVEITQADSKALGFDWYLGNFLLNNGAIGTQAGTAPSFTGRPTRANPQGTFPGPGLFPGVPGPAGSQPSRSDGVLSASELGTAGGLNQLMRNQYGGLNGLTANNVPALATVSGILTDPQFRMVVRALEQRRGVDLLNAPRVVTTSGRQTQIAVVDAITVISGVNLNQAGAGGGGAAAAAGVAAPGVVGTTLQYISQQIPFGPVLDVIPYISADGYSIQLTIIPTLTEFLGYDDPGPFVPQGQGAAGNAIGVPIVGQQPLPRLRSRQVTTSAIVWDGQTVVLGGLITESVIKIKDKIPVLGDLPLVGRLFRSESSSSEKRNLIIFVTPTIIDPAGNRVHRDEDLPFAQTSTPIQPVTEQ